ncbi:hypothetical protein MMC18_009574 [Xylographa bjoerkii]|nr:hypothetical protein [Xylographa bjoerkii]
MGASAPKLASEVLGWQYEEDREADSHPLRLRNGLYLAEWLHLSAHSWGGLCCLNVSDQAQTSQVPINLVLGTSETNSCMTRYEKAWQRLFKDERQIHNLTGILSVVRNPSDDSTTSKTTVFYDAGIQNEFQYTWRSVDIAQAEEGDFLLKLAEKHKFLAYSISYKVRFDEPSIILGTMEGFEL